LAVHDDSGLVEGRIARELHERLVPAMYRRSAPMAVEKWEVPGEPAPFAEACAADFAPTRPGEPWSRPWGTTWFRCSADVPGDWAGPQLELSVDLGFGVRRTGDGFQAEGLVFNSDGSPLQGIHPRRTGVPLPHQPSGPLTVLIEAASNPPIGPGFRPTPMGSAATAGDRPVYRLGDVLLCERDDTVFHLLLDIEVLDGLMRSLPKADPRRARLLRVLETAFDTIDMSDISGTAAAARMVLSPALQQQPGHPGHRIVTVGHAHIDTAWLWPMRETIRKCTRTFASATRLMDDYPEYTFACSQAVQYEWIEQRHPALFERIAERVTRGQWLPVGGMWVEPDMNLPSGESLVRQFVHGQRYFSSRFGRRCDEVWIPDVFGYPASLPQVFASAGCARFITQKLSWNQENVFPHSTFLWEGLDGTRVLTHFPPVDTYNASITAEEVRHAEHNFKDAGWSDWSLMPYGHGNGGGGPTREMVERGRRMAGLDGLPALSPSSPSQFFASVEAEIACGAPAPVWRGELYFEMHRGTLTSQAATKAGNRRCERLLREAELWWASSPSGTPPAVAAELDRLWKDTLTQQFHDVLPGSSIAWVHADAEAEHRRVGGRLVELIDDALAHLGAGRLVANAATHARREVMVVDDVPTVVYCPGLAAAPLAAARCDDAVTVTESSMTNGHLAVRWDLDGVLTSIIDVRRARQLLPEGRQVTIDLAPDHPVRYDAWDLESWTHRRHQPLDSPTTVRFERTHPLMATLCVERTVGGHSRLVQRLTLRAGSPRLDVHLSIDWHEDEQLLSMMVPLDVRADHATCDIQFGAARRPTHASNSWDAAKFEVCAHRFVDLSEPSFGAAVLNDGRYGHNVQQGGVRVSLLRAAKYPDPSADHGHHEVTVSIMPHGPGLHEVLAEAEALNTPLRLVSGSGAMLPPLVRVDHPGVQVTAVKHADDGSGDLVVRLYEACGDRVAATVHGRLRIAEADRCNVLEDIEHGLDTADGIVTVQLRPFEIVTLRLRFGDGSQPRMTPALP
jgi:alpha-mannosidase